MRSLPLLCLAALSTCGPQPTKADFTAQRATPFFQVLVYEELEKKPTNITVMVFTDPAGGCFITSGTDGGVVPIPDKTCRAAVGDVIRIPDVVPNLPPEAPRLPRPGEPLTPR